MELEGTLVQVMDAQSGTGKTGNTWKKQDFLIEIPGQYPKKALFTLWGDKVNIAGMPMGTKIKVSFDLDAREYNGRWYNDVKAWKVESAGENPAHDGSNNPPYMPPPPSYDEGGAAADDDLPF